MDSDLQQSWKYRYFMHWVSCLTLSGAWILLMRQIKSPFPKNPAENRINPDAPPPAPQGTPETSR